MCLSGQWVLQYFCKEAEDLSFPCKLRNKTTQVEKLYCANFLFPASCWYDVHFSTLGGNCCRWYSHPECSRPRPPIHQDLCFPSTLFPAFLFPLFVASPYGLTSPALTFRMCEVLEFACQAGLLCPTISSAAGDFIPYASVNSLGRRQHISEASGTVSAPTPDWVPPDQAPGTCLSLSSLSATDVAILPCFLPPSLAVTHSSRPVLSCPLCQRR